jgi:hypothetical protein
MKITLAGYFVTSAGNLSDYIGLMLTYPAENEERRLDVEFVQKIKGEFGISLYPALESLPVNGRDESAYRTNMTIILKNNTQYVSRDKCS